MLCFTNDFEAATGIAETYDPDGDRESGYLSNAWWKKYAEFLEFELVKAQQNTKKAEKPLDNKAKDSKKNMYI